MNILPTHIRVHVQYCVLCDRQVSPGVSHLKAEDKLSSFVKAL